RDYRLRPAAAPARHARRARGPPAGPLKGRAHAHPGGLCRVLPVSSGPPLAAPGRPVSPLLAAHDLVRAAHLPVRRGVLLRGGTHLPVRVVSRPLLPVLPSVHVPLLLR